MINLSKVLREYREAAGLKQQQVADAVGVKRSAYAYYETGQSSPKLKTLTRLAKIYNLTVDELLAGAEYDDTGVLKAKLPDGDPEYDTGRKTSDKFNQLTEFEKSVLLKVRLMDFDEKEKLIKYLEKNENGV